MRTIISLKAEKAPNTSPTPYKAPFPFPDSPTVEIDSSETFANANNANLNSGLFESGNILIHFYFSIRSENIIVYLFQNMSSGKTYFEKMFSFQPY